MEIVFFPPIKIVLNNASKLLRCAVPVVVQCKCEKQEGFGGQIVSVQIEIPLQKGNSSSETLSAVPSSS